MSGVVRQWRESRVRYSDVSATFRTIQLTENGRQTGTMLMISDLSHARLRTSGICSLLASVAVLISILLNLR